MIRNLKIVVDNIQLKYYYNTRKQQTPMKGVTVMKKVNYSIDNNSGDIFTVTIRLEDREAMKACLMMRFTGFTLDDAIHNANKRLNVFGYEIGQKVPMGYGYDI